MAQPWRGASEHNGRGQRRVRDVPLPPPLRSEDSEEIRGDQRALLLISPLKRDQVVELVKSLLPKDHLVFIGEGPAWHAPKDLKGGRLYRICVENSNAVTTLLEKAASSVASRDLWIFQPWARPPLSLGLHIPFPGVTAADVMSSLKAQWRKLKPLMITVNPKISLKKGASIYSEDFNWTVSVSFAGPTPSFSERIKISAHNFLCDAAAKWSVNDGLKTSSWNLTTYFWWHKSLSLVELEQSLPKPASQPDVVPSIPKDAPPALAPKEAPPAPKDAASAPKDLPPTPKDAASASKAEPPAPAPAPKNAAPAPAPKDTASAPTHKDAASAPKDPPPAPKDMASAPAPKDASPAPGPKDVPLVPVPLAPTKDTPLAPATEAPLPPTKDVPLPSNDTPLIPAMVVPITSTKNAPPATTEDVPTKDLLVPPASPISNDSHSPAHGPPSAPSSIPSEDELSSFVQPVLSSSSSSSSAPSLHDPDEAWHSSEGSQARPPSGDSLSSASVLRKVMAFGLHADQQPTQTTMDNFLPRELPTSVPSSDPLPAAHPTPQPLFAAAAELPPVLPSAVELPSVLPSAISTIAVESSPPSSPRSVGRPKGSSSIKRASSPKRPPSTRRRQ